MYFPEVQSHSTRIFVHGRRVVCEGCGHCLVAGPAAGGAEAVIAGYHPLWTCHRRDEDEASNGWNRVIEERG